MKIAITSKGKDLSSDVDPRFGRARWFIVYDTETDKSEVCDNEQNMNSVQGAGIQAAQKLAQQKVGYVLTGHCGPNAFRTLNLAGIKVIVGAQGTVLEAIEQFGRGQLAPAEQPDVQGHWSSR
jgi:predicted Fe-Mo cluster-binding NifX family protein